MGVVRIEVVTVVDYEADLARTVAKCGFSEVHPLISQEAFPRQVCCDGDHRKSGEKTVVFELLSFGGLAMKPSKVLREFEMRKLHPATLYGLANFVSSASLTIPVTGEIIALGHPWHREDEGAAYVSGARWKGSAKHLDLLRLARIESAAAAWLAVRD